MARIYVISYAEENVVVINFNNGLFIKHKLIWYDLISKYNKLDIEVVDFFTRVDGEEFWKMYNKQVVRQKVNRWINGK